MLARAHQNLIWVRNRHTNRLRNALRYYYPVALEPFVDLADRDALAVLAKAPSPTEGAKLSVSQIRSALKGGAATQCPHRDVIAHPASGAKRVVLPRYVRNRRLYNAIDQWEFSSITTSQGCRDFYDQRRAKRRRPPPGPTSPWQPARRRPPRLPPTPHHLQWKHRLGTPPNHHTTKSSLTKCTPGVSRSVLDRGRVPAFHGALLVAPKIYAVELDT